MVQFITGWILSHCILLSKHRHISDLTCKASIIGRSRTLGDNLFMQQYLFADMLPLACGSLGLTGVLQGIGAKV